jgi:hypothetical protein
VNEEDHKLLQFLGATVESIRDRMTTREDIASVRKEMTSLREEMVASFTVVRGDIERVQLRIDSVDRTMATRLDGMDNQISRLRSVVYLLGKDQPEVLRLLGGTPL